MRFKAVYIILLFTFPLEAQMIVHYDTIKINEVVISGKQIPSNTPGFKTLELEKSAINTYGSSTLGSLLSAGSPLFIKDYGAGGMSTPSFRGTGASHTLVLWNGININHPMLGQSDLSLISPGIMDKIIVSPGASSMKSGNGGFGGSIELDNEPEWDRRTRITLNQGIGSFGNYTGSVNAGTGTENFQTSTKAYFQKSENDFTYLDTYSGINPVEETRKNGQVIREGLVQEIYFRKERNALSARIWYQETSRNLTMPVISQQVISGEKQTDQSLRSMIDYSFGNHRNEYFVTAAWIMNNLDYTNRLASIHSENRTGTLIFRSGMSGQIGKYTTLKVTLNNELSSVSSNNYKSGILRNNTSFTVSAERRTRDRLGASVLLRETVDNDKFLIPDFSAGIEYRLFTGEDYLLYGNISRNSHIASLNDLYWYPGGNPDLKNEYAYSGEIGYRMKPESSSLFSVSTDICLFGSRIRDMIQWYPGEFSYWTAGNIKSVNASGLESFAEISYSGNRLDLRLNAGYTYTRSVNEGLENEMLTGKQLIYIPENQVNGVVQVGYGKFYSSWMTGFTGRRYISPDNSEFLPGYTLNSMVTGVRINLNRFSADINFRIDNLFNVNYQSISYYPQPGRSYFFNIKLQYDKL